MTLDEKICNVLALAGLAWIVCRLALMVLG